MVSILLIQIDSLVPGAAKCRFTSSKLGLVHTSCRSRDRTGPFQADCNSDNPELDTPMKLRVAASRLRTCDHMPGTCRQSPVGRPCSMSRSCIDRLLCDRFSALARNRDYAQLDRLALLAFLPIPLVQEIETICEMMKAPRFPWVTPL